MPEGVARQRCRWERKASVLEGMVFSRVARLVFGEGAGDFATALASDGVFGVDVGSAAGRSLVGVRAVSGTEVVSVILKDLCLVQWMELGVVGPTRRTGNNDGYEVWEAVQQFRCAEVKNHMHSARKEYWRKTINSESQFQDERT